MKDKLRATKLIVLLALAGALTGCFAHSIGWPDRDFRGLVVRDGVVYERTEGPGGASAFFPRDHRWAVPVPDASGLPNLFRVTSNLYRGGQPTEEGFRTLAGMGVTTIINLRSSHCDRDEMEQAGVTMGYHQIPFVTLSPSTDQVAALLSILRDAGDAPVFVHCRRGADRTGMMIAAYRVVAQGWGKDDALAEMTRGGFSFNANFENLPEFIRRMDAGALARASGWSAPEPEPRTSHALFP